MILQLIASHHGEEALQTDLKIDEDFVAGMVILEVVLIEMVMIEEGSVVEIQTAEVIEGTTTAEGIIISITIISIIKMLTKIFSQNIHEL